MRTSNLSNQIPPNSSTATLPHKPHPFNLATRHRAPPRPLTTCTATPIPLQSKPPVSPRSTTPSPPCSPPHPTPPPQITPNLSNPLLKTSKPTLPSFNSATIPSVLPPTTTYILASTYQSRCR